MNIDLAYVRFLQNEAEAWWKSLSEESRIARLKAPDLAEAERRFRSLCIADQFQLSEGRLDLTHYRWSE